MNENEKIPFHEKRRQNFLSEEKYQKEKNGYLSNLKFWDNNVSRRRLLHFVTLTFALGAF